MARIIDKVGIISILRRSLTNKNLLYRMMFCVVFGFRIFTMILKKKKTSSKWHYCFAILLLSLPEKHMTFIRTHSYSFHPKKKTPLIQVCLNLTKWFWRRKSIHGMIFFVFLFALVLLSPLIRSVVFHLNKFCQISPVVITKMNIWTVNSQKWWCTDRRTYDGKQARELSFFAN